ncbi:MAG: SafA/ExsA family spore coat assembly protein [Clostridia bacterium]|nr:SafA/ExsA family spore coat assembly protein [Clostridia bacterium]
MKKVLLFITLIVTICVLALSVSLTSLSVSAESPQDSLDDSLTVAATTYTVQSGDSLWKIAVRYEIGIAELIKANPQIANPSLIYVGQKIAIPEASPLKTIEDEIFRLVNVQRVNNGLQPLKNNWQAARVARIKSQDMIDRNYFSHTSPTYGSPFKMMEAYGLRFSSAAENIAYGQRSAAEVMNSWMNSPGHRANILSRNITEIGVGVAKKANGTMYFTQMFLKPL